MQDFKRFRNDFEQLVFMFTKEASENITLEATQARIVEANKQYEQVISGAKPQVKMF